MNPRVEMLVVCDNYSDFLEHTLPENLNHVDDIIVVTSHADQKTKEVCRKYSVHYIETDAFTEKGHTWNKGAAINSGLNELNCRNWILQVDADIVLPRHFRRSLEHAQIREENIYGADRINVYGYDAWAKVKPLLDNPWQGSWFVDPGFCHAPKVPEGVKFGARVIHKERGYLPIGYFQLFHGKHGRRYNYKRGAAAGTDCNFPMQWPRPNRVLLPDIVVWHLDSELTHNIGTNWHGRKSSPFKPAAPKPAPGEELTKHHHETCHDYDPRRCHHHHRHHGGHCESHSDKHPGHEVHHKHHHSHNK